MLPELLPEMHLDGGNQVQSGGGDTKVFHSGQTTSYSKVCTSIFLFVICIIGPYSLSHSLSHSSALAWTAESWVRVLTRNSLAE